MSEAVLKNAVKNIKSVNRQAAKANLFGYSNAQERVQKPRIIQPNQPVLSAAAAIELSDSRNFGRRSVLTAQAATCACCASIFAGQSQPALAAEWDYVDPKMWAGVCSDGTEQSPVDLPPVTQRGGLPPALSGLNFDYATAKVSEIKNTGHGTMQISFGPSAFVRWGSRRLKLVQFHYHAPSEHSVNGIRYAMEAHLVHQDIDNGQLVVLGTMLDRGAPSPNPAVQYSLALAPKDPKEPISLTEPRQIVALNPLHLLPARAGRAPPRYLHYRGSLTTPPCSEEVEWIVFEEGVRVTDQQVLDFMRFSGQNRTYGQNARPVQIMPNPQGRNLSYYNPV